MPIRLTAWVGKDQARPVYQYIKCIQFLFIVKKKGKQKKNTHTHTLKKTWNFSWGVISFL